MAKEGAEYVYKPDWGEQLVGKHQSVVIILNIQEDTITPVASIPDDYFPAQVMWAPNGDDIVGIAYKLKTRYLGLYACTNRESYVFHLKRNEFRVADENYNELSIKMLKHSPIIHADKVKASTLIVVGSKDLRVPSSQGKLSYSQLLSKNVITK